MTDRNRTRSSSAYANEPARLPALPTVRVSDASLQRFLDAVRENIEVRAGARGDQFERAVTLRDMVRLGLLDKATYNGSANASPPSSQGSDSIVLQTPSGYRSVDFDYFARQLANSTIMRSILKPLSDPARFDSLSASVRALLVADIKREAATRGADIQRLETRLQTAEESVATLTTEVTAGLGSAVAGVRETAFATATQSRATAGVVTQISAAIGDPASFTGAGITLEQAMFGIASLDEGLYGQYTVKIDANGYVAGFGLAVEATGANDVSSAFIVAADKFAIVDPTDTISDPLNPPAARIPFGVDTVNNTVFINGNVRIDAGGPTLSTITTGKSTYTATVYKQTGSAPSAPTGGSFNFNTSVLTPPTGWVTSQPATTTTPTYACEFTFVGSPTATVSGGTWSTPYIDAVAGSSGTNGESVLVLEIFLQTGSAPSTPTGGSYTFASDSFTPPSGGWSRTMPASSTTPTYRSVYRFATTTPATPVAAGTWGTPVIVAQNGSPGSPGSAGTRGTRQLYDTSASYTASYNNGAGAGAPSYAAQATTLIASATSGSTPTTPIKGDTVTFTNGSSYTYTITYNGSAWAPPGVVIDGSLLVTGSVTTTALSSSVSISTAGYAYIAGYTTYTITDVGGSSSSGTASVFANGSFGARFGVVGYTSDSSGAGIHGYNASSSNGPGVSGRGRLGVYGAATADTGAGGYFQSFSGVGRAGEFIGYVHATGAINTDSSIDAGLRVKAPSFYVDQTPATGSGTASFPGNNKPGGSTSAQWLAFSTATGTVYIPCWA